MDKLGIVGSSLVPGDSRTREKKVDKKKKSSSTGFKSRIHEAEDTGSAASAGLAGELTGLESAEDLLDDVYRLGEDLKHDGTLKSLRDYRAAVQKFYKYVVTGSLEASRVEGRLNPRTMSRKQYTLIAVVDEKLEKLGAAVLQNQKQQLNLLKKIDEIYGILIDLTR